MPGSGDTSKRSAGWAAAEAGAAPPVAQALAAAAVASGGRRWRAGGAAASGVRPACKVTPEGGRFWDPKTHSCAAPPWGELIAVNANTGDIAWRVPLGSSRSSSKGIKTGTPSLGGGDHHGRQPRVHRRDHRRLLPRLRCAERRELWRDKLDAPAHSIPATYMGRDGKQYVVITAGGGGFLRSPHDAM